jgi:hypothetical protein
MTERAREATGVAQPWRGLAGAILLLALLWPRPTRAAGPLGDNGDPIRTSSYKVDLAQTPVVGGSRVTGIAGAYVAIAEGIDGNTQTPVSPAVRPVYSYDYFDYDLGVGLTLTSVLRNTDFFNTGRNTSLDARQTGFVFITPALNLTYGSLGFGLTLELQHYDLSQTDPLTQDRHKLGADFLTGHMQLAYSFFDQQLTLGLGARVVSLSLSDLTTEQHELFSTEGVGAELGVLLRPNDQQFRIGGAFRSSVTTTALANSRVQPNAEGDRIVGTGPQQVDALWLPNNVALPWDLNLGAALMLGPRRFNPFWYYDEQGLRGLKRSIEARRYQRREQTRQWLDRAARDGRNVTASRAALEAEDTRQTAMEEQEIVEHERRARMTLKRRNAEMSRRYVLISSSVVFTGAVREAVGVASFLSRVVDRSGQDIVVSPRLGLETETVPNWVKVRAGSYAEPTRSAGGMLRVHGTIGLEAKVFPWNVFGLWEEGSEWRISGALDVAQRYLGWGIAIGNWH